MEINFFPINIGFEEFQISRTKYSDKTLKELRNKYNKSHSFFRDGDYIYISYTDGCLLGKICGIF